MTWNLWHWWLHIYQQVQTADTGNTTCDGYCNGGPSELVLLLVLVGAVLVVHLIVSAAKWRQRK